eukprot:UN15259
MLSKDADGDRAQMPCGHIIGCGSMTGYVRSLLDKNEWKIPCPAITSGTNKCGITWEWKHIKIVGAFTDSELKEFEGKSGENYAKDVFSAVQCPHCEGWVCRPNDVTIERVSCQWCKGADFCYSCCMQP